MQKRSFRHISYLYRPYDFPSSFPVLVFLGDYWQVEPGEPQFLHFHNGIEIGHCLEGETVLYREEEEPLSFSSGDFSLVFPQQLHIMASRERPSRWEFIYIEPKLLVEGECSPAAELWPLFYMRQIIPARISSDGFPSLYALLRNIFQELHMKSPLYQDIVHGLLYALFARFNRMTVQEEKQALLPPQNGYACIRASLSYIYDHYMEPLSVRELAERCHISESHFRRLFHTTVGISPLDYIQHYRIRQACHLIHLNQKPINVIAQEVGYTSLSSFNRQFQQYLGQSPSSWKKDHLSDPYLNEVRSYDDPDTQYVFQV